EYTRGGWESAARSPPPPRHADHCGCDRRRLPGATVGHCGGVNDPDTPVSTPTEAREPTPPSTGESSVRGPQEQAGSTRGAPATRRDAVVAGARDVFRGLGRSHP